MAETLTPEERELLAKTISEALSGRITINFLEVSRLLAAAKKVGTSREHVVQGLGNWLRTDPQAQELVMKAFASIGSAFTTTPAPAAEPDVG